MKLYKKFIILTAFLLLFVSKSTLAAGSYSDEGTAFYAKASSYGYSYEGIAFHSPTTQITDSVPVYRFYNSNNGDHFYTISESEKTNIINHPEWNYKYESIAFYAFSSQLENTYPVYRFNNTINGDHFYTSIESEKTAIISNPHWGYKYESIAFYSYKTSTENTSPVYRFYNSLNGDHFYTTSENEKINLSTYPIFRFFNPTNGDHFYTISSSERNILNSGQSGYLPEGTAFFAYKSQVTGSLPVHRFYNSTNGDHFYTISENEKTNITNHPEWNYKYEGIAFYAFASQVSGTLPVYRFANSTTGDHFYTISEAERYALVVGPLGPEISVGLWYYSKPDFMDKSFKIDANKPYVIKDASGNILTQVGGSSTTTVNYNDPDNELTVNVGSYINENASKILTFEAADGNNTDMIFDTHRSTYVSDWRGTIDHYRGKIKVQYYRGYDIFNGAAPGSSNITQIWINNILPLEQYTWGAAELKGTGDMDHTMVMVTAYRTYGFRWIKYANYYAPLGFKIRSDSGSQNYGGYDWETKWPNIKKAAEQTRGTLVTYGSDAANTPYSKWSDGKTVTSPSYAWCKARTDEYGNYNDSYWNNGATKSHDTLVAEGNHMIGLIAQGSVRMATAGWNWQDILRYYYTGIGLVVNY